MKRNLPGIGIFLVSFFLFLGSSFAKPTVLLDATDGTDVGNGGFAVACLNLPDSAAIKWYFSDYYNPSTGEKALVVDPTLVSDVSVDINVKKILANYAKIDPDNAKTLLSTYEDFWTNSIAAESNVSDFIYVNPEKEVLVPKYCVQTQIISNVVTLTDSTKQTYLINFTIFSKLDAINKTAAVLHEIIYDLNFSHKVYWGDIYSNVVEYNQFILLLPNFSSLTDVQIEEWKSKNEALKTRLEIHPPVKK